MNHRKAFIRPGITITLVFALLLVGCQPKTPPVTTRLPTEASQLLATGKGPSVVVNDQEYDGKTVVIAEIDSVGPGWMAVHTQVNGELGPVIGYTHLEDGVNRDVAVQVDPGKVTDVMYAMLHTDAGKVGVYEFPGPDVPVLVDGQMVSPPFKATIGSTGSKVPVVQVTDQDVTGGVVKVPLVISVGPGWLAIHSQVDGEPGPEIGYVAVKDGENREVAVQVDPSKVTPLMYAMLHTDAGEVGTYEYPGPDVPETANGQMVAPTFKTMAAVAEQAVTPTIPVTPTVEMNMTHTHATPAPGQASAAIQVTDQEIKDGQVTIDKVVSSGPGWVAIYTQKDGQPDALIGYAPVKDGENSDMVVKVDASKATPELYALLFIDAGTIGTFEFPGPDTPVLVGVRIVQAAFKTAVGVAAASTPSGSIVPTVKVEDQEIRGGTVKIAEVISKGPGWLGIHIMNPDGSLGSAIGYAAILNGDNQDVLVKINISKATEMMHAMLHTDAGQVGTLEFPGPDVPVQHDGDIVMTPFHVTGGLAGQDIVINVAGGQTANLVDGQGMSLYVSTADAPGKSNCTGKCQLTWLPLLATGKLVPGEGVTLNKMSVIILPNGAKQVTYGGLPLYYYFGDTSPGDTAGQGIDGQWFLSTP